MKRRVFITGLSATSFLLAAPAIARTRLSLDMVRERSGEKYSCEFGRKGIKDKDKQVFDRLMRDLSAGEVKEMDVDLYEVMAQIQAHFGGTPLTVKSGYRTRKTNASIRGAARKSLHVEGRAVDFSIKGVQTIKLVKAAQSYGSGGVGYYPRRGFIHMDTGEKRYWRR